IQFIAPEVNQILHPQSATFDVQQLILTKLEFLSRKIDDLTHEVREMKPINHMTAPDVVKMRRRWLRAFVYDAVRKMKLHGTAQNSDIKANIQYWLKNAKGRATGWKKNSGLQIEPTN
ncbi:unnamed protein product, partial [Allacma fusca]